MSAETAIVDDGGCVFRCGGKIVHSKKNSRYSVAAVALLFMQDEDKPHGSAYLSLSPIGPVHKTISARNIRGNCTFCRFTARREEYIEVLGGQSGLRQNI